MGRILQIRVTSWTWDEDLVVKAWPRLAQLAFTVPLKHEKHGVMEMVTALGDGLAFMKWPETRRAALGQGIEKAVDMKCRIEGALEKWNPREANALSDELETLLDRLEDAYK
ncbi:MAG: hypothetical protein RRY29_03485 [Desulfovibrionaceae bacterium]